MGKINFHYSPAEKFPKPTNLGFFFAAILKTSDAHADAPLLFSKGLSPYFLCCSSLCYTSFHTLQAIISSFHHPLSVVLYIFSIILFLI